MASRFSRLVSATTSRLNNRAAVAVAAAGVVGCGAFMTSATYADNLSLNDQIASLRSKIDALELKVSENSNSSMYLLNLIAQARKENPNNLGAKHFDIEYYDSLSPELKKRLLKIIRSGAENPDSSVGVYAMNPEDYDLFKPYLDKIIREYHGIKGEVNHVTNWSLAGRAGLPEGGVLDLKKLGLPETSMRVRVGRNLAAFPLPGAMTRDQRIQMESEMVKAFEALIKDPQYGGRYYSLTPNTSHSISHDTYQTLVDRHFMFKDMANDPYLASAGISADWPYGRGCYISKDEQFIVWVGEEDHLRIMCMKKGFVLNEVFDRLATACNVVEKVAGKFAHSKQYGYVTSCPTNLGTGMRASVHIALPKLTKDGQDVSEAKKACKSLGLSVRGIGGEHTAPGKGGIVDISPSARLQIQEGDIVCRLYSAISLLISMENKAAPLADQQPAAGGGASHE